ncbi:hypothetical protein [Variovorax sp.]|jgi:hypothetical protein|uniref:hypothetical protein n=1 Tax=Variovorax sp. TaxID=1871043 RepID=UPI0037DA5301
MAAKYSTGFRNAWLGTGDFKTIMAGMVLKAYTAPEPASADDAKLGTLLCTYSTGGTGAGLALGAPASGSLSKVSGDAWSGIAVASGTPAYFRWELPGDDGSASTTAVRIQGKVGLLSDVTAQLGLSSLAIVNGAPQNLDAASLTVPATV